MGAQGRIACLRWTGNPGLDRASRTLNRGPARAGSVYSEIDVSTAPTAAPASAGVPDLIREVKPDGLGAAAGAPVVELRSVRKTYYKPDGSIMVEALRGVDI